MYCALYSTALAHTMHYHVLPNLDYRGDAQFGRAAADASTGFLRVT